MSGKNIAVKPTWQHFSLLNIYRKIVNGKEFLSGFTAVRKGLYELKSITVSAGLVRSSVPYSLIHLNLPYSFPASSNFSSKFLHSSWYAGTFALWEQF